MSDLRSDNGGKRSGAGRPRTGGPRGMQITFYLTAENRAVVEASGLTIQDFFRACIARYGEALAAVTKKD